MAKILKTKEDAFELRYVDVQRQIGGNDCSLFAMAFVDALCLGQDPHIISYAQEKMRYHLISIFESEHVLPFPQADRPKRYMKRILCGKKKLMFIASAGCHGAKTILKMVNWFAVIIVSVGIIKNAWTYLKE